MPIEPLPCADGGGGPVEVTTCCSPAIAATPLCRADGSPLLVVIRSGCAECDATAPDPATAGWIDPVTGAFTAGPPPADAGPCPEACAAVTTVELCDLLPGGGCQTFLRHLLRDCDGTVTSSTDTALDGLTSYTVTGTAADCTACSAGCLDTLCVQRCDDTDGDGAADQTFSELWCVHADGSTELLLTYSGDPSTPYTPVAPVECTYGCPESETVTLCDASGPFLRRYTWLDGTATYVDYALDGSTPHVVTGTVGACAGDDTGTVTGCCAPSIASAPLCRANGTSVLLVVRSGCVACGSTPDDPTVVGWIDSTTGVFTAGQAPADAGPCTAGCLDTVCRTRCDDTDGDGEADTTYSELWCIAADGTASLLLTYQDNPATPYTPVAPVACSYATEATETLTLCDDAGPFLRRYSWLGDIASFEDMELDGATPHVVTGTVGLCLAETPCQAQTTPAATLGLCLADGTPIAVLVTRDCDGEVTQDGWLNLTTGTYSAGNPPVGTMACGHPRSITTAGTFCDVDPATGDVLGLVLIEYTYGADGAVASVRLVDATTGQTYTPQGEVTTCPAGVEQPERDLVQLCDTAAGGAVTQFVRDYARDESGAITGHTDYLLDGTPYTPTGTVGVCSPAAEPCRSSSSLLLCDLPTDGAPAPTVTDTPGGPYYPYTTGVATPGAQALWDGGTLTLPDAAGPQPGTGGTVRTAAAIIQAPRPVCDTGTAHVTAQVDVTQLGPDAGCRITGFLGLYNGPGDANRVAIDLAPPDTPVGWSGTLTVEADVPAADLAAGNIAVLLAFDAYDDSGAACPPPRHTGWQLSAFTATTAYDQTGCDTQFLRTVTVDCETGAVTAVVDTTMDGQPYTLTGEPGQCSATGGSCCPEQPCPAHTVLQECRCDDTDGDGLPDVGYVELLAVDCQGTVTSLGTYTDGITGPYTPVAPVSCDAADEAEGAPSAFGVQAHRVELAAGAGSWDAAAIPALQSVTAVAHGGTGTITTVDGASTLHTGEAATWSVARDEDAALTGPLTITADTGTVTVTWTRGVTLS
ncbi:hypothetical protein [Nonomuraea sp. NPDC049646]|uniref:hypothetical protein n=1 Tax=unclassified Nonomuraea TaxID=2593643 RepID=UPI003796BA34